MSWFTAFGMSEQERISRANADEAFRLYTEYLNKQEQTKMTREEAINKCINATRATGTMRDIMSIKTDLVILEALGLIKFEEPKTKYVFKDSNGVEYKVMDTFIRWEP